jgi:hypothetical protein
MKNLGVSVARWMASGKPGWNKAVAKLEKLQIPATAIMLNFLWHFAPRFCMERSLNEC